MGNKPDVPFADGFSTRMARHSRVAFYPIPLDASCAVYVPFVIDQLLVGAGVHTHQTLRQRLLEAGAEPVARVFDKEPPDGNQVEVWRLRNITDAGDFPDVAEFVWRFREEHLADAKIDPGQVAPNHILIPAAGFHSCPHGPPSPVPPRHGIPKADPMVAVAVIDSGWENLGPVVSRVGVHEYVRWLQQLPDGSFEWAGTAASPLLTDDGQLYALAGHANFVAGVIAQAAPAANISVHSLNAAFVEADDSDPGIPTEASVARAIWNNRNADLLHVGFAFPTLPATPLTSGDAATVGPPSWSLQAVIDALPPDDPPFIIAPAGNQGCTIPQYPAAFGETRSNVIGVGSLTGNCAPSAFSNRGPWVTCATQGEAVESTLFDFEGETEEPEPGTNLHPFKDFEDTDGWASWSGTSFSSPKVTAALATRKAEGARLDDAWADLIAGRPTDPEVGILLDGLAP